MKEKRIWKNGVLTIQKYTPEELAQMEADARRARLEEASRPLTDSEILRIDMRRRGNSLNIDNATAGRMVDYFPTMSEVCKYNELIPAKTRIRDDYDPDIIWRATVDLWNMETNSPVNAPTLWERVAYKNGIRIAPETFTSTNAAELNEYMWFGEEIWKSNIAGNTYTPEQSPATWTLIM